MSTVGDGWPPKNVLVRDTKQVARVELSSMDVDHVVSLHEAIPGLDEVDWWITLGGVDTIQAEGGHISMDEGVSQGVSGRTNPRNRLSARYSV